MLLLFLFHNPYLYEIIWNIFPTLSFMVTVERQKGSFEMYIWNLGILYQVMSEHSPPWWNFA